MRPGPRSIFFTTPTTVAGFNIVTNPPDRARLTARLAGTDLATHFFDTSLDQVFFIGFSSTGGFDELVLEIVPDAGTGGFNRCMLLDKLVFVANQPPEVDGSLLAVEDHGDDDAEFIVQATATDPEDGTLTPTIDLVAIDEDGNESVVALLNVGDKIRLRVDEDEVEVEVASGGDLVDNEFNVRAEASSFRVDFSVTDSGGLSDQDAVTVDLSVTGAIHEAEPDVSDQPIVID